METSIAQQIVGLLNSENQLVTPYTEEKVLASANHYLYLLNERDKVISCIECKKVQWYQFEVRQLTVDPEYRKNGNGKNILEKAVDRARRNGGRVVQCTIREGNEACIALFIKSGFIRVSVFDYPNSGDSVGVWQKVLHVDQVWHRADFP